MDGYEQLIEDLRAYAHQNDKIECVLIVGSRARGDGKEDSDIDFVIISAFRDDFLKTSDFAENFGHVVKMQLECYGACISLRAWYDSGCEAEFGFVESSWIKLPLDTGTRTALRDGYKVIVDKNDCFKNIKV